MPSLRGYLLLLLVPLATACGLHPLPEPLLTEPTEMATQLAGDAIENTFLGEARIEYFGQGQARKGNATVMTAPNGLIRLDVFTFTDDLISYLVVSDGEFRYFERGQKVCFAGPFCAAPMVSRFPSLADPARISRVLRGEIPLLQEPDEQELSFSRREGLYHLRLTKGPLQQLVKVQPDGKRVKEALLKRDGKVMLKVTFDGWLKAGKAQVPKSVRIQAPADDVDLSVTFRDAEFGYQFTKNPFALTCPAGLDVEYLVCPEGAP